LLELKRQSDKTCELLCRGAHDVSRLRSERNAIWKERDADAVEKKAKKEEAEGVCATLADENERAWARIQQLEAAVAQEKASVTGEA
jgi:hypothetical protein